MTDPNWVLPWALAGVCTRHDVSTAMTHSTAMQGGGCHTDALAVWERGKTRARKPNPHTRYSGLAELIESERWQVHRGVTTGILESANAIVCRIKSILVTPSVLLI